MESKIDFFKEWVFYMGKIKILMISTDIAIAEHYMYSISHAKNMKIIDVATNGYDGVLEAGILKPDIILLCYNLESPASGVLAANALLNRFPHFKVIMICSSVDDDTVSRIFSMGVYDILPEEAGADEILNSIYDVNKMTSPDYKYFSHRHSHGGSLTNDVKDSFMYTLNIVSQLKPWELEIIKLLIDGADFKDIAHIRGTSIDTVVEQVDEVLEIFNKKTVTELLQVLYTLNITEFLDNIV